MATVLLGLHENLQVSFCYFLVSVSLRQVIEYFLRRGFLGSNDGTYLKKVYNIEDFHKEFNCCKYEITCRETGVYVSFLYFAVTSHSVTVITGSDREVLETQR